MVISFRVVSAGISTLRINFARELADRAVNSKSARFSLHEYLRHWQAEITMRTHVYAHRNYRDAY